jgi:NADPH2:quinone reductase
MVKVRKSTIIDAPVEAVWRLLRDFNGHEDWHPAVAESRIEDGRLSDQIGCVRRFTLSDGGGELREQLLALSDAEPGFTYCILEAPMPLMGYVATMRLRPVTDGQRTFIEWESSFTTPPGAERELADLVGDGIYEAGFAAIKARFGGVPAAAGEGSAERPTVSRADAAPAPPPVAPGGPIEAGAMVLERYGGPEAMSWQTLSVPPPGPGQVRLRHTAIGLNYIDVYCRTGYFDLLTPPGPLGMEAAGVVLDVGEGVHGIMAGDRVAYACPPVGAYTEARTMDADLVAVLPDEIDDATAAAVMLKGMTAEFLLHRVHAVQPGDTILVHAAAGGVGLLLCQWASQIGATVIGTVSSEEKARLARANGCAHPIVTAREDFVARVQAITEGRGADVVYDAVGRDTFLRSYEALAVRGHLVSFGQASGPIEPIDIGAFAGKSATVSRPNYGHYVGTAEAVRAISRRLFEALRQGHIRVEIGQRFALREADEAHRCLEARATMGSSILVP